MKYYAEMRFHVETECDQLDMGLTEMKCDQLDLGRVDQLDMGRTEMKCDQLDMGRLKKGADKC